MNDENILSRLSDSDNARRAEFFERDVIVVFARAPIVGQVKSRLAQKIGAENATEIYAAMLRDCLELAQRAADGNAGVLVAYTPSDAFEITDHSLAHFWKGARHFQGEGDLTARLLACFSHLKNCLSHKVIIIGSDAPDIPFEYLRAAFDFLDSRDLVFGPAADGGFYLIGARDISPALFEDVAWSSASTLATILGNASRDNQSCALLDSWRDVDEIKDLHALAMRLELGQSSAPHTQELLDLDSKVWIDRN